jgi:hypothetical protein
MSYNRVARTMFVATAAAAVAALPALQASAEPPSPSVRGAPPALAQGTDSAESGALRAAPAASASAGPQNADVFVQVTPSTVQAGDQVEIQASCDGNDEAATVRSDAFGRTSVSPNNGVLTGMATVPDRKTPNTYDVVLTCPNQNTASTTLTVVNMSKATRGPATGAGGSAGGTVSPLVLTGGLGAVAVGAGLALVVRARRGARSGG